MIDGQIVEQTWQEAAQLDPERAIQEMQALTEKQPNLLAFVMAQSADLEPQVQELVVYLFFVVHRMFATASGRKLKQVSEEAILAQMDADSALLDSLENADDKFFQRAAEVQSERQPHVMRYIVEAILEIPDDDPTLGLTEEDEGSLFLILKTVVDLLDQQLEG